MTTENNLADFWDKKVPKGHKHFIKDVPKSKTNRLKQRINQHFFEKLDFANIRNAIDWGCGGGLHTKTCSELCNVIPMDISQDSLNECKRFTGIQGKIVPNNLKNFDFSWCKNIDLIFCADVIHHFPNLGYFIKVTKIWSKIAPRYLCLQFKLATDKNVDKPNYFASQNYIHSLFLTKEYVIAQFPNYKEISFGTEKGGKIRHAFLVLEKNQN